MSEFSLATPSMLYLNEKGEGSKHRVSNRMRVICVIKVLICSHSSHSDADVADIPGVKNIICQVIYKRFNFGGK